MKSSRVFLLFTLAVMVAAGAAAADVKIRQKMKNSGFAGIGASESEEVTYMTTDKSKTVTTTRFTGGVVGFFAGKKPRTSAKIVRLDKELIWDVDDEEKEYKETTFAKMRAEMEEFRAKMKSGDMEGKKENEDPDVKVNIKFDVNKAGEKKTINGFDCNHIILTLTVEEENLKTKEKRDLTYFIMDQWLHEGRAAAKEEMEAFQLRMAKAMGVIDGPTDFLSALMAQYGENLRQLQEKAKEIKGLPILQTTSIETPGGAPQEEVKEEDEEEKPKIGLPGGLGGLFGKKKEKDEEEKSEKKKESAKEAKKDGEAGSGRTTIFSVTTEVVEVSTDSASPSEFEIPKGYEKKD